MLTEFENKFFKTHFGMSQRFFSTFTNSQFHTGGNNFILFKIEYFINEKFKYLTKLCNSFLNNFNDERYNVL